MNENDRTTLEQAIYTAYNGKCRKDALPMKF